MIVCSRFVFRSALWVALLSLFTGMAEAHHLPPGMEDLDEFDEGAAFLAGMRHSWAGAEHWIFALLMGVLLASRVKLASRRFLGGCLLLGLGLGAWLGLAGKVLPGQAWASEWAVLMPLLLLTWKDRSPVVLTAVMIFMASLWQGNQHGASWPLPTQGWLYAAGLHVAILIQSGVGMAGVAMANRVCWRPASCHPSI